MWKKKVRWYESERKLNERENKERRIENKKMGTLAGNEETMSEWLKEVEK